MSAYSGPEISNDGLVFHFDMENTDKSFKGKPTTNLSVVGGKYFSGNGNFTTNETIQDVLPDGSIGDVRYLKADYVVDVNRTVSIGNYNLTAGSTYTLSFYVKNINCTGFNGNLYSPGLGRVIGGIGYPTIYTDRWTRVVVTFTVPDEGVDPVTVSPQVFRDGGYGFFKMSWLQLEEGSIATAYADGTRSSTEAILDMTGQNIITSSNLSYNSDNTFELDGTDDYFETDRIAGTGTSTASVSWSIWTKPNSSAGNIMSMSSVNPQGSWNMPPIAADGGKFRGKIWSNRFLYSDLYTQGQWYLVTLVFNYNATSTERYQRLFVNGEMVDEQLGISYSSSNTDNYLYFGQSNPGADNQGYYAGEIGKVQVYNRALSPQEVKNNYLATKSRYGL